MSAKPSGERTEKATPKRKREAKEQGQILKSTEVVSAFSMLAMFGMLLLFGNTLADGIMGMMRSFFTMDLPNVLDKSYAVKTFGEVILSYLRIIAPMLLAAIACGFIFNIAQSGWNFTAKPLAPKFSKINPMEGFKRIFSKRTVVELIKSIIKIAVLVWVAYGEYTSRMDTFPMLMGQDLLFSIPAAMDILLSVGLKLGMAYAIFAPFDFFYQWWRHNKDLMMTKEELKEEYKLTEGNPQTKSRISQKRKQVSRMRMIQAVKDADVVITNPTHFAVALAYKEQEHTAPVVVAKGKDYLAQTIKERAREWNVEIVENKPVAQALYFFCEVGDEVPEDMYKAVAEILAYVYKLKNKQGVRP
ncbi:MAG: flagellar biosynthesis protein FlhB [Christensenellales bacterium]|jgi:flagellar biosynthetic protein FlhB